MEKVLISTRTSLDPVKAIVKWLIVHGYQVEDWLFTSIQSNSDYENGTESESPGMNGQDLGDEVIQKLTRHVDVNEMTTLGLRAAARIFERSQAKAPVRFLL